MFLTQITFRYAEPQRESIPVEAVRTTALGEAANVIVASSIPNMTSLYSNSGVTEELPNQVVEEDSVSVFNFSSTCIFHSLML